ncbi:hypothetical protein [Aurantivibrio plasticivorans]
MRRIEFGQLHAGLQAEPHDVASQCDIAGAKTGRRQLTSMDSAHPELRPYGPAIANS